MAALNQAAEFALHHRMRKMHGDAAQQAIDLHRLGGDEAVRACLMDLMHRSADRNAMKEFLLNVALHLHQNGRPELGSLHHEAVNAW